MYPPKKNVKIKKNPVNGNNKYKSNRSTNGSKTNHNSTVLQSLSSPLRLTESHITIGSYYAPLNTSAPNSANSRYSRNSLSNSVQVNSSRDGRSSPTGTMLSSCESLIYGQLVGLCSILLRSRSKSTILAHDSALLSSHVGDTAIKTVDDKLSKILEKLTYLQGPQQTHKITACAQLLSELTSDIEAAVFSFDRLAVERAQEEKAQLHQSTEQLRNTCDERVARKDQTILALQTDRAALDGKNKALVRTVELLRKELEKTSQNLSASYRDYTDLRIQAMDYKCETDRRAQLVLGSVVARLGFVPSSIQKSVDDLTSLKPPGDSDYDRIRAKQERYASTPNSRNDITTVKDSSDNNRERSSSADSARNIEKCSVDYKNTPPDPFLGSELPRTPTSASDDTLENVDFTALDYLGDKGSDRNGRNSTTPQPSKVPIQLPPGDNEGNVSGTGRRTPYSPAASPYFQPTMEQPLPKQLQQQQWQLWQRKLHMQWNPQEGALRQSDPIDKNEGSMLPQSFTSPIPNESELKSDAAPKSPSLLYPISAAPSSPRSHETKSDTLIVPAPTVATASSPASLSHPLVSRPKSPPSPVHGPTAFAEPPKKRSTPKNPRIDHSEKAPTLPVSRTVKILPGTKPSLAKNKKGSTVGSKAILSKKGKNSKSKVSCKISVDFQPTLRKGKSKSSSLHQSNSRTALRATDSVMKFFSASPIDGSRPKAVAATATRTNEGRSNCRKIRKNEPEVSTANVLGITATDISDDLDNSLVKALDNDEFLRNNFCAENGIQETDVESEAQIDSNWAAIFPVDDNGLLVKPQMGQIDTKLAQNDSSTPMSGLPPRSPAIRLPSPSDYESEKLNNNPNLAQNDSAAHSLPRQPRRDYAEVADDATSGSDEQNLSHTLTAEEEVFEVENLLHINEDYDILAGGGDEDGSYGYDNYGFDGIDTVDDASSTNSSENVADDVDHAGAGVAISTVDGFSSGGNEGDVEDTLEDTQHQHKYSDIPPNYSKADTRKDRNKTNHSSTKKGQKLSPKGQVRHSEGEDTPTGNNWGDETDDVLNKFYDGPGPCSMRLDEELENSRLESDADSDITEERNAFYRKMEDFLHTYYDEEENLSDDSNQSNGRKNGNFTPEIDTDSDDDREGCPLPAHADFAEDAEEYPLNKKKIMMPLPMDLPSHSSPIVTSAGLGRADDASGLETSISRNDSVQAVDGRFRDYIVVRHTEIDPTPRLNIQQEESDDVQKSPQSTLDAHSDVLGGTMNLSTAATAATASTTDSLSFPFQTSDSECNTSCPESEKLSQAEVTERLSNVSEKKAPKKKQSTFLAKGKKSSKKNLLSYK